jgi:hypothetical protein
MLKEYYLQPYRTIILGIMLIFAGCLPVLIIYSSDNISFSQALLEYLKDFISFPGVIVNLIFLSVLISGILFLKNSKKIIRARLDDQGFHYVLMKPGRYTPLVQMFWVNPSLELIPYHDIKSVELVKNVLTGDQIVITTTTNERPGLKSLMALKNSEKSEIVELIQKKIAGHGDKS